MKLSPVTDRTCSSKWFGTVDQCLATFQSTKACKEPSYVSHATKSARVVTVTNSSVDGRVTVVVNYFREVVSDGFLTALLVWCCSSDIVSDFSCKASRSICLSYTIS